ncbi:MAG: hypothetical protein KDB47_05715 [Mycobacterium sp.]|nr:hypothetical protein [Mycobacterium sp.]
MEGATVRPMMSLAAPAIRRTLTGLSRRFDRADHWSTRPFDEPEIMVPNVQSRKYGWTHFGVMIPDLPEPHRFFSAMSLIGATGSLAFDNDHALADVPRRNASIVAGTAASHPAHFGNYSTASDFVSHADGSLLRFGDDLTISGHYPDYHLGGRLGGVDVDLRLTNTDKVNWFFRNPVYKHFSLLTEYRGYFTETDSGRRTDVEGLCAFEYGACPSLYQLRSTPLPSGLKAPLDYFVYQIINLGSDDQVLLSHYCLGGQPFMTTALARSRNEFGRRFEHAKFRVEEFQSSAVETPYGIPMRIPAATTFTAMDSDGIALEVRAELDTSLTFGLGSGFVTGFRHRTMWKGRQVEGRGYMEYIDRRAPVDSDIP